MSKVIIDIICEIKNNKMKKLSLYIVLTSRDNYFNPLKYP